jgi:hypothetical protein
VLDLAVLGHGRLRVLHRRDAAVHRLHGGQPGVLVSGPLAGGVSAVCWRAGMVGCMMAAVCCAADIDIDAARESASGLKGLPLLGYAYSSDSI